MNTISENITNAMIVLDSTPDSSEKDTAMLYLMKAKIEAENINNQCEG